jgi:hypothetical protein
MDVLRDSGPLLQTEGVEFQVIHHAPGSREVTIPYSYSNLTGSKVLLANCNGDVSPRLEMKRGGRWVTAWVPVRLMCKSAPIEIMKGAVYRNTLHVYAASFGSNAGPQFAFEDVEGTYRLRWDEAYSERKSEEETLPLKFRISNEFLLRD